MRATGDTHVRISCPLIVAALTVFTVIAEFERALKAEVLPLRLAQTMEHLEPKPPRPAAPAQPPPPPRRTPADQPTARPAPTPAGPQSQPDADRARNQGAKSGRVQVILAWDNENDLDLVVNCAGGGTIFYLARQGCGGGELDIDRNAEPPIRRDPIENIVWSNEPPNGRYGIAVMHNGNRQGIPQPSSFRVTLRVEGRSDQNWTGRVAPGATTNIATFAIPAR